MVEYIDVLMPDMKTRGQVVWHEPSLRLIPQDLEENTRGGHYIAHWDMITEIEVIGNIYEGVK